MTFETDAATVGLAADVEVARVQGLLDTESTHANALALALAQATDSVTAQAVVIVDLKKQVADLIAAELTEDGTPPPPPPVKTLIGTSPGPLGFTAAVGALAGCNVFRSFQAGLPTTIAADPELAYLTAHGIEVWYSFGSMPTQAQFTACVKDWVASGKSFWWTYKHEVDGGKSTPAQFVLDYDNLQRWAEAVPGYAAAKVRDQPVYMSYMLTTKADGTHPHGDPKQWLPTRPTRLGFDCYTQGTLALARDFCKSLGKDWVVPEWGAGGPGGEGGTGDVSALAWAKTAVASWAPYPPQGACWYASQQGTNARSDTLTALPMTAAYLSSLA